MRFYVLTQSECGSPGRAKRGERPGKQELGAPTARHRREPPSLSLGDGHTRASNHHPEQYFPASGSVKAKSLWKPHSSSRRRPVSPQACLGHTRHPWASHTRPGANSPVPSLQPRTPSPAQGSAPPLSRPPLPSTRLPGRETSIHQESRSACPGEGVSGHACQLLLARGSWRLSPQSPQDNSQVSPLCCDFTCRRTLGTVSG